MAFGLAFLRVSDLNIKTIRRSAHLFAKKRTYALLRDIGSRNSFRPTRVITCHYGGAKLRDLIRINQPLIGREEIEAVTAVLKSGILTDKSGSGPRVLEFEREFARYVGVKHAIAVSSGTAALHCALLAANVKRGDEVLVPSFTFAGTVTPVLLCGARPVFSDIQGDTYCMSLDNIENSMSRETKVIVPVHLYGLTCDMDPIIELARKKGVTVIEDAAQAHGAAYKQRKAGSMGDMACFSFYSAKNMTTGEGGMITTNDDDLAQALRMIRTHGEERPYWVSRVGNNYHMTEMAAALGIVQLRKLQGFVERRRENAKILTKELEASGKLATPVEPEGMSHAWYLYTVRVRGANAGRRNKIVERLRNRNIEAAVYYETPVHLLPLYREVAAGKRGTLPETEKAARQVFSLPIHPAMTPEDLSYVAEMVKKAVA
jgi:dTDP-4-amino-4,6-dideoxygalactose transaminase